MSNSRLNIVNVSSERSTAPSMRLSQKKELEAKFERLWLIDPNQFNPLRNCMQKERLDRTWDLLVKNTDLTDKNIVDLGCGAGVFSRRMRDGGGIILAVDIAYNALKHFSAFDKHHIETKQEAMPNTTLPDNHYDVVVAMELIAELPPEDYRLFFAELARLIKPDGTLVCSSPIDIDTEGGVERLINYAQTEFDIMETQKSYDALHIRLKRLCEMPAKFIEAWKNKEVRKEELSGRSGIRKWLFYFNSSIIFMWFWVILEPLMKRLLRKFKDSRKLLVRLEKICQFLSNDEGISHITFIGKRRPLDLKTEPEKVPLERPGKKVVWE